MKKNTKDCTSAKACRPVNSSGTKPSPGNDGTEADLVLEALRMIDGKCDGAKRSDGKGFSRDDTDIGKALAKQDKLSPPQLITGRRLVRKYRRQVPSELLSQIFDANLADSQALSTSCKSDSVPPNLIGDEITKEATFAQGSGGKLYVYQNGVYSPKGEQRVRRRVKSLLNEWKVPDQWDTKTVREVIEYIRTDAPELWEEPPLDVINVRNGLLNINTGELKPHTPEHLSPIQIPVEYIPRAKCSKWNKFIRETFPKDTQDLAWEIPAFLLTPDTSIQKAVLLVGEGGNGKSTFLSAVTAFVGKENISSVSLHQLESGRFATARLVGKLANVCADLSSRHLEDTAVFKAITGGDVIEGEYKFKSAFTFRPYARLVFSANRLPLSRDSSQAFFDRWVVVPFEKTFRDTDREVSKQVLDAQLAGPKKLSGVLNKALEAVKRLRERGKFTESQSTQKALAEYRQVTDHFTVWVERVIEADPEGIVPVSEIRKAYNRAAVREGRPVMTETQFGKAMKRVRPDLESVKRGSKGHRQMVYLGIKLKGH